MKRQTPAPRKLPRGTRLILQALDACVRTSGRTMSDVAQRAGFARQYLYLVLGGKTNPTLDTIERIFHACGDELGDWIRLGRRRAGRGRR